MLLADRIAELEAENEALRLQVGEIARREVPERLARRLALKPQTVRLLFALRAAAGRIVPIYTLEDQIKADPAAPEYNSEIVKVHVCWARAALGRDAIETSRGFGFSLTKVGIERFDTHIREVKNMRSAA